MFNYLILAGVVSVVSSMYCYNQQCKNYDGSTIYCDQSYNQCTEGTYYTKWAYCGYTGYGDSANGVYCDEFSRCDKDWSGVAFCGGNNYNNNHNGDNVSFFVAFPVIIVVIALISGCYRFTRRTTRRTVVIDQNPNAVHHISPIPTGYGIPGPIPQGPIPQGQMPQGSLSYEVPSQVNYNSGSQGTLPPLSCPPPPIYQQQATEYGTRV